MKTKLLKYYIAAFYLCSTFVTFAQETPGTDDEAGTLENADAPAAPIEDYVWVLATVGLLFVFFRLRSFAQQRNMQK